MKLALKTLSIIILATNLVACNKNFSAQSASVASSSNPVSATAPTQINSTQPKIEKAPDALAPPPAVTQTQQQIAQATQPLVNNSIDEQTAKNVIRFLTLYPGVSLNNLAGFYANPVLNYSTIDPSLYDAYYRSLNYVNSLDAVNRELYYHNLYNSLNYAYHDKDWVLSPYYDYYDIYDYDYGDWF